MSMFMVYGSFSRLLIKSSRIGWCILSKHFTRSASMNQTGLLHCLSKCCSAEWQPLPGLNPCDSFKNMGSNRGTRMFFRACCTILSRLAAIPSGLVPPLALGMSTLRAGVGLYEPSCRSFASFMMFDRVIFSIGTMSTPGLAPLFIPWYVMSR